MVLEKKKNIALPQMGFHLLADWHLLGFRLCILLVALEWAANYGDHNNWIIWLALCWTLIGLAYHLLH
jgi:hypothetical protein